LNVYKIYTDKEKKVRVFFWHTVSFPNYALKTLDVGSNGLIQFIDYDQNVNTTRFCDSFSSFNKGACL